MRFATGSRSIGTQQARRQTQSESGKPAQEVLAEAWALHLDDQSAAGPDKGFGRLWYKRHRIQLAGTEPSPRAVIAAWKEHFGEFWPGDNRFYGPLTALRPGELGVISLEMPGQTTLSTGVILVESGPDGFTLVTPRGHMLAGRLHFSASRGTDATIARVEMLIRAADPLFEIGMVVFGHRRENEFWEQTLRNLAAHFGSDAQPETTVACRDRSYQWRRAANVWHNGAIRNLLVRAKLFGGKTRDRLLERRS
jgi:hypothetical protein